MSTPHIAAERGQIAETVLMGGDPLRMKFIAENYLENAVCYSTVRNAFGYTGLYKGVRVSVQAHGMGMPSMGIYSWELMKEYGCENLIRIGTTGSIREDLKIGDVVFSLASSTDSNWQDQYKIHGHYASCCDFTLLRKAVEAAEARGIPYRVGNTVAEDVFYNVNPEVHESWERMGCLCVEMEASALYMNAAYLGKRALALFTVSDEIKTGKRATAEERERSFTNMIEIGLGAALAL